MDQRFIIEFFSTPDLRQNIPVLKIYDFIARKIKFESPFLFDREIDDILTVINFDEENIRIAKAFGFYISIWDLDLKNSNILTTKFVNERFLTQRCNNHI